jgi:hypothetical protein
VDVVQAAAGVGIGLSRTPELSVSSGSDVFDFEHWLETYIVMPSTLSEKTIEDEATVLSLASLGLGVG